MEFDLKTKDGLRNAIREAERQLDRESIARNADFLEKVSDTPETERDQEAFLRLVWVENPLVKIYKTSNSFNVMEALSVLDFRRQFLKFITFSLPDESAERAVRIDSAYNDTLEELRQYMSIKPWQLATRAFVALFPNDFTTVVSKKGRNEILESMGEQTLAQNNPAQENRRILERLDEALGAVDRSDWNAVAQRMMLPEVIFSEFLKEGSPNSAAIPIAEPLQTVRPPPLGQIKEYFELLRDDGELVFDDEVVEALHLGLWAHGRRHLGVLTGLSGTGKTQLALRYAEALTGAPAASNEQICTIPVQPGWYDPTQLLGYVNPLGESRYEATEFLRFLMRAAKNPGEAHVCVLDEMNLSHPEQYLAPILSAMERDGGDIPLHGGGAGYGVPPSITYPQNLILIGTVNMDETTMGISDKVLDRAFTLEFWDIDVDRWPGWDSAEIEARDKTTVKEVLAMLMDALRSARLHFGWRVIAEVVQFMELGQNQSSDLSVDHALDRVIYAKVLPKLRGDDSPRFRDALEQCKKDLTERQMTRCAGKVSDLIEDLNETGSFRFWR